MTSTPIQHAEIQAQRDKAVEAINSVLSGEYDPRKNKNELCKHERYGWEDCGQCVDEYLVKALKDIKGE